MYPKASNVRLCPSTKKYMKKSEIRVECSSSAPHLEMQRQLAHTMQMPSAFALKSERSSFLPKKDPGLELQKCSELEHRSSGDAVRNMHRIFCHYFRK